MRESTQISFFIIKRIDYGQFYSSDGAGGLYLLLQDRNYTGQWDLMTAGDFDEDGWTDILGYNRLDGFGEVVHQ